MRFLTRGHPNFRGYWKVNVEQALGLSDRYLVRDMYLVRDLKEHYCYLSCGFKWRDRTTGSEPWVLLYTESFQNSTMVPVLFQILSLSSQARKVSQRVDCISVIIDILVCTLTRRLR